MKKMILGFHVILIFFAYSGYLAFSLQNTSELNSFQDSRGLYGFKNVRGEIVIPAKFKYAYKFNKYGIAAVQTDNNWQYINTRGRVLLQPFIFDNGPDYFQEGLARCVNKNNKVGFFTERGIIVIKPKYDFATPFSEGFSSVCIGCKNVPVFRGSEYHVVRGGKWGIIDKTGKILVKLDYDHAERFNNGVAELKKGSVKYFVDRTGRIYR